MGASSCERPVKRIPGIARGARLGPRSGLAMHLVAAKRGRKEVVERVEVVEVIEERRQSCALDHLDDLDTLDYLSYLGDSAAGLHAIETPKPSSSPNRSPPANSAAKRNESWRDSSRSAPRSKLIEMSLSSSPGQFEQKSIDTRG